MTVTGSRVRRNPSVKVVLKWRVNHSGESVKHIHVLKIKKLTTVDIAVIFLAKGSWKGMIPTKVPSMQLFGLEYWHIENSMETKRLPS